MCRSPLPWEDAAASDELSVSSSYANNVLPNPHAPMGSSDAIAALSMPLQHSTSRSSKPPCVPPPSTSYQQSGGLQPQAINESNQLGMVRRALAPKSEASEVSTGAHGSLSESQSHGLDRLSESEKLSKKERSKASLKKFVSKLKLTTKDKHVTVPVPHSSA
jgi:hypothetical protein